MRRLLLSSLVIALLVVSTLAATPATPVAHADCQLGTPGCDPCPTGDTACQSAATAFTGQYGTDRALVDAANKQPAPAKGTPDEAYNSIMMKIMQLFAWLVGIAMLVLNYAAYFTVVTMGSYVKDLTAVGATWQILRDLGNIMLIFGFLAVGVTTILNVNWYGGGKKMLPMMLVAAVFLNFSLFISEAFIDVSNLFATQFYTQITGTSPSQLTNMSLSELANQGISGKIMYQLGLASLYGQAQTGNGTYLSGSYPWLIGFMGILLFIVLAFVLFSLAFVLIARFVILLLLIITSPIAFAGLAVPNLSKRMHQWWDKLFEQVVTAPILFLLLYIALKIITAENFLTGFSGGNSANWVGFADNIAGFGGVLLSFLVAMALLMLVVIQSKSLSAFGAGWASQTAGKLSFGATAAGLRWTAGWGLQGASQAIRRSKLGGTKTGRLLATTFDRGATSSFDIRGVKVAGYGLAGGKVDAGDAQKGGYRARREAAIKGHQDYIKSVHTSLAERDTPPNEEEQKVINQAQAAVDAAGKPEEVKAKFKAAKDAAEKAQTSAQALATMAEGEFKGAKTRFDEQKAQVDQLRRMKEEEEKGSEGGVATLETERKLREAENALYDRQTEFEKATKEKGVADALLREKNKVVADTKTEEAKALNAISDAEEALKKAKAAPAGREKKEVTKKYAENIEGSLPGWALFGPGGGAAARKIKADAAKTPAQRFNEDLQKALEAANKPEDKKTEPPPAPPPAGTH